MLIHQGNVKRTVPKQFCLPKESFFSFLCVLVLRHNRLGESPLVLKMGQRTFNLLFLELKQYTV